MTRAGAHAGETVGRAVGTGLRTLRRGAGQVAAATEQVAAAAEHVAAAAEQRLSDGLEMAADARTGVTHTGRKARKQLAREAKLTAKELARSAKQVKKTARTALAVPGDLVAAATPKQRRKKWPWLLGIGLGVAAAGTAYALKSRSDSGGPAADNERDTAEARHEQQVNGQPSTTRQ